MSIRLKSYVMGQWVEATGGWRPLVDPTTGEVLAEASTQGVDLAGAVAYARERGLPALRALTFAERGALLEEAVKALHARRDELLELSTKSGGNTRGDAKFDVDGAIGTLSFYAKLGAALGDATFFTDGDGVQLGRGPRFWGQHVMVPRQGVAVHINAFNFPAWGMAEKLASALLAGLPVISKPATSTSILCQRITELLVDARVFPEGALSCVVGSAGDLLDHLGVQDVLAFTGSSETAVTLRSHDAVLRRGCRLNVEADSLNAAVLGADVSDDDETFDVFLADVVRDMTQKAGQKCTAIRRIFVPEAMLDVTKAALLEQLAKIKTGDPSQKGVRMGPVSSAAQLEDVMSGIERLKGCCELLTGGDRGDPLGVDGDEGYFVQPTLFFAADAEAAAAVHEHEVFGPVATLLSYSGDPAEAARLVALGRGGLVASVYTDSAKVAGTLALGLAPWSGRVNVGTAKVAADSLGPGAVLPQLLHGGPGRAGGGEELGGVRGLALYLQRTALQGYKPLLVKLTAGARAYP